MKNTVSQNIKKHKMFNTPLGFLKNNVKGELL